MRAVMIEAFGDPIEVLELVDAPEPARPASGEVLVGVEYAPINPNDLYLIRGTFLVRPSLPSIVGNEGVGRVLGVGSGVEHLRVGDRVLIPLYAFSWCERLLVPAAGLFSLPDADPRQLAMLGINPPTASLLLDEATDFKPGDWVIQNAANSGVGRSLIAIAKSRGIKTINLVRRPELVPELRAAGGDVVIAEEGGTLNKIRAAVGRDRVRLAIDGVAGESSAVIAGALSVGFESGPLPPINKPHRLGSAPSGPSQECRAERTGQTASSAVPEGRPRNPPLGLGQSRGAQCTVLTAGGGEPQLFVDTGRLRVSRVRSDRQEPQQPRRGACDRTPDRLTLLVSTADLTSIERMWEA